MVAGDVEAVEARLVQAADEASLEVEEEEEDDEVRGDTATTTVAETAVAGARPRRTGAMDELEDAVLEGTSTFALAVIGAVLSADGEAVMPVRRLRLDAVGLVAAQPDTSP